MGNKALAREGRVTVRKFRRGDLQERLEWPPYTDPFLTHLNFDLTGFIERERWIFARIMNSGRMYFAIEDENGKLAGEVSLRDVDAGLKASRLGIHLASNKVGQGYGGEGLRAVLSHYFRTMQWNVVFLDVAAYNHRAIRLYEREHFEHLEPFWRKIIVDESVLADPEYAGIRKFLRQTPGGIEGFHYDMGLTKERYFHMQESRTTNADDGQPVREGRG